MQTSSCLKKREKLTLNLMKRARSNKIQVTQPLLSPELESTNQETVIKITIQTHNNLDWITYHKNLKNQNHPLTMRTTMSNKTVITWVPHLRGKESTRRKMATIITIQILNKIDLTKMIQKLFKMNKMSPFGGQILTATGLKTTSLNQRDAWTSGDLQRSASVRATTKIQ